MPWFPARNVISLALNAGTIADRLPAVDGVVEEPTIIWVTVASVVGMPTTEFINE